MESIFWIKVGRRRFGPSAEDKVLADNKERWLWQRVHYKSRVLGREDTLNTSGDFSVAHDTHSAQERPCFRSLRAHFLNLRNTFFQDSLVRQCLSWAFWQDHHGNLFTQVLSKHLGITIAVIITSQLAFWSKTSATVGLDMTYAALGASKNSHAFRYDLSSPKRTCVAPSSDH